MKTLAIATTDGTTVCDHLARSTAFVIVQLETDTRALRPRFAETCGNHSTFIQLLEGCDAIICGGIGQGAADSLSAHNITALVIAKTQTIEDTVAAYRNGTLSLTTARHCLCG